MKKLYEFNVYKEEEVTKQEENIDTSGNKVIIEKKVKEKVPYKFFIRKPTRSMTDANELHYGVVMADGVKRGLLTAAQLYKRFLNDGGILSEPEKKVLENAKTNSNNLQYELQKILSKTEQTPEDETKIKEILNQIGDIRETLQKFEYQQSALFDQTAENRARNQAILWYVLYLSYKIDKDGKELDFFSTDGTLEPLSTEEFDAKLKAYDDLVEENEDEFLNSVVKKIFYFVSFWYMGRATTAEDFKQIDEVSDKLEE
jgi:hypothetical protein